MKTGALLSCCIVIVCVVTGRFRLSLMPGRKGMHRIYGIYMI